MIARTISIQTSFYLIVRDFPILPFTDSPFLSV